MYSGHGNDVDRRPASQRPPGDELQAARVYQRLAMTPSAAQSRLVTFKDAKRTREPTAPIEPTLPQIFRDGGAQIGAERVP